MLIELDRQDDICVMRLEGRFVTGMDPQYLRDKTDEVKSQACNKVLVDLRQLLSIGSTGIGFLVSIHASVTKQPGGRFVLAGAHPHVLEVLQLTRLDRVMSVVTDIAAGLATLRDASLQSRSAQKS